PPGQIGAIRGAPFLFIEPPPLGGRGVDLVILMALVTRRPGPSLAPTARFADPAPSDHQD
ncbi:MAG: hypothetical protein ACREEC_01335, partial [Thermoplasmata archaeon]